MTSWGWASYVNTHVNRQSAADLRFLQWDADRRCYFPFAPLTPLLPKGGSLFLPLRRSYPPFNKSFVFTWNFKSIISPYACTLELPRGEWCRFCGREAFFSLAHRWGPKRTNGCREIGLESHWCVTVTLWMRSFAYTFNELVYPVVDHRTPKSSRSSSFRVKSVVEVVDLIDLG